MTDATPWYLNHPEWSEDEQLRAAWGQLVDDLGRGTLNQRVNGGRTFDGLSEAEVAELADRYIAEHGEAPPRPPPPRDRRMVESEPHDAVSHDTPNDGADQAAAVDIGGEARLRNQQLKEWVDTNATLAHPKSPEWMSDLDARYRAASGLDDRRYYSIFYSQIRPSPVLVLGANPGGDPETWTTEDIADTGWYEDGQHEYVDMDYPIAVAMRAYLAAVLDLGSLGELRHIPKSNIAFRRSASTDTLSMSLRDASIEAAPFVAEIIDAVDPSAIIFEGAATARLFAAIHARGWEPRDQPERVTTPNGRHHATIFEAVDAELADGREVVGVVIGHPSRYARRAEWQQVVEASRRVLVPLNSTGG